MLAMKRVDKSAKRRPAKRMVTEAPVRQRPSGASPAEASGRLVQADARNLIRALVRAIAKQATDAGMSAQTFAEISSEETRPFIEADAQAGYASPAEGLAALLNAEGVCVDVAKACEYYRKPKPVSRQAINEAIRRGELLAYRTGADQYMLPTWQFRPEGGVIEGFPEALQKVRETIPGADQLTPFAFFHHADPVTGGRTPLEALRAGDREQVFAAIEARRG
jgi:hypothetical protein